MIDGRLVGADIKSFRAKVGISQRQLAQFLGSTEKTVAAWENERSDPPQMLRWALAAMIAKLSPWCPSGHAMTAKYEAPWRSIILLQEALRLLENPRGFTPSVYDVATDEFNPATIKDVERVGDYGRAIGWLGKRLKEQGMGDLYEQAREIAMGYADPSKPID